MKAFNSKILCTLLGAIVVMLGTPPALADDSEVFTSSSFTSGAGIRPNVLFIIDTSGSMASEVITYDPSVTYDGTCDKNLIYWQTANSSSPPACTTNQTLTIGANRCRTAWLGMEANGWWNGRLQQLNSDASAWQNIVAGQPNRAVECEGDAGNHGDVNADSTDGSRNTYARNGTGAGRGNRWGNSGSSSIINWTGVRGVGAKQRVSLYNGNYINWFTNTAGSTIKTRLQIVKDVAKKMIADLNDVNLGLMRYSNNQGDDDALAEGGMVTYPVSELTTASRAAMTALVDSYNADGFTPLSETMYEAYQYLAGRAVDYGNNSKLDRNTPFLSVPGSRVGGRANAANYDSPMDFTCQKTFIVYLTDGLPTADTGAETKIQSLPGFATDGYVPVGEGGGGDRCTATGPDGGADGRCLVNLAGYMFNHDSRSDVATKQNITTYFVGFGDDIATSKDYLDNVAKAGGGKAYTQNDSAGLTAALEEIFSDVVTNSNTTFVSPTVAVNAFNRTRNLNSLYVSVFAPSNRIHWPGNVKKYQLINGVIHGTDTMTPAVNATTGFFDTGAKDLFNGTVAADGPDVKKGGAASKLPAYASRNVYTYLGSNSDLTTTSNALVNANAAITAAMLGLPGTATAADRTELIEFIRGRDVRDDNDDTSTTDDRLAMGDPMRTRPAVGIYSGTEASPSGVVFMTTNDGMLHAIDMNTGDELWAFVPPEFLSRQSDLLDDPITGTRQYAIDGDVRLFKYDVNGNGVIDSGDKMWAIFGFGRGGSTYYALDVTARGTPRFLWKKDSATLTKLGQAWSNPVITRVNVNSASQTDPQKFVMIFGGGYDTTQENYTYAQDGTGNAIYMLELATGNKLWMASRTGVAGANFTHAKMTNSIPADITVLDLNGDGYADRMYAGDMGGRIWRFDIWHGQAPATLVSGGILASLGAGDITSPTLADTRRFYYRPDVAVVTPRGSAPYLNIAIGSGYRGHPLETDVHDSFFAVRDYQPFNRRTTASYASPWTPVTVSDLVNVTADVNTAVPDGSKGWILNLNVDGWRGEKVLAEAVTAAGVIFFPTFTPRGADPANPCLAKTLNRTYAVYLESAKPFGLRDGVVPGGSGSGSGSSGSGSGSSGSGSGSSGSGSGSSGSGSGSGSGSSGGGGGDEPADRFDDLNQGGIAPGTAIIQTPEGKTLCLNGVEEQKCVDIGDVTRTYWERRQ